MHKCRYLSVASCMRLHANSGYDSFDTFCVTTRSFTVINMFSLRFFFWFLLLGDRGERGYKGEKGDRGDGRERTGKSRECRKCIQGWHSFCNIFKYVFSHWNMFFSAGWHLFGFQKHMTVEYHVISSGSAPQHYTWQYANHHVWLWQLCLAVGLSFRYYHPFSLKSWCYPCDNNSLLHKNASKIKNKSMAANSFMWEMKAIQFEQVNGVCSSFLELQ